MAYFSNWINLSVPSNSNYPFYDFKVIPNANGELNVFAANDFDGMQIIDVSNVNNPFKK